jgi:hypothetical protein
MKAANQRRLIATDSQRWCYIPRARPGSQKRTSSLTLRRREAHQNERPTRRPAPLSKLAPTAGPRCATPRLGLCAALSCRQVAVAIRRDREGEDRPDLPGARRENISPAISDPADAAQVVPARQAAAPTPRRALSACGFHPAGLAPSHSCCDQAYRSQRHSRSKGECCWCSVSFRGERLLGLSNRRSALGLISPCPAACGAVLLLERSVGGAIATGWRVRFGALTDRLNTPGADLPDAHRIFSAAGAELSSSCCSKAAISGGSGSRRTSE